MARGINMVILVGNLGNDPDTRYTQAGMAVTRISLATTSVRKNRDGEAVEETQWHRVVFFGKLGEIAGEYLRKGSQVYVEGTLRYSTVEGDDGQTRYYTDIVSNEMQMLGGQRSGEGSGGASRSSSGKRGGGGGGDGRSTRQAPQRQAPAQQQAPLDDFADDDISF